MNFIDFEMIFIYRRNRSTRIHPDNRQDVELLRQRSQDHGDRTHTSSNSGRSEQDTCPICLIEPPALTVETNCGHKFCGSVFFSYQDKRFFYEYFIYLNFRKMYYCILEISIKLDEWIKMSCLSTTNNSSSNTFYY